MALAEPPVENSEHYTCPHCGTLTDQRKVGIYYPYPSNAGVSYLPYKAITVRSCRRCKRECVWYEERLLYPLHSSAPLPNPDLPQNISSDFEEARVVANLSPRSAAALLRVALEKLCNHLEARGKNLNEKIGWLVMERHLDPVVQQALDIVRVVGNDAVHPGVLDMRDNPEDVAVLFNMLNEIADELITRPKRVRERYEMLPQEKRSSIERRDRRTEA